MLALLLGIIAILKLFLDLGALKLKTDTMWDVLMKGALVAAKRTGALVENSPLRLNPEVPKLFGELGDRMKAYYAKNGLRYLSDSEAVLLLARKFGDEIMARTGSEILPNFGAALIAALELCKEGLSDG